MNLYKISIPKELQDYDMYSNAVVCAESEEDAKTIHPNDNEFINVESGGYTSWAFTKDQITVQLIGIADPSIPRGVVCASFHAG